MEMLVPVCVSVIVLSLMVLMLFVACVSVIAKESGTRMGTRNGKPGPMRLPDDGRARGEVVRERGLLIDVVG